MFVYTHKNLPTYKGRSGRPSYVSLSNAFNKQELGKADLIVLPVINFWRGDS